MIQQNQIYWIDCIKTILIYLMVLGHITTTNPDFKQWIYTFHMPCFFIVSGFLYKPSSIKKSFESLFFPVFIISIFNLLYRFIILFYGFKIPWDLKIYILYPINSFILFPSSQISSDIFTGLWYIEILFLLKILTDKFHSWISTLILVIICTIYHLLKINNIFPLLNNLLIERIIHCYFFFIVGVYIHKVKFVEVLKKIPKSIAFFCAILSLCCLYIMSKQMGTIDIYSSLYGNNYILYNIIPPLYFISFSFLFYSIERFIKTTFIEDISIGTLLILGIHSTIISIISRILKMIGYDISIIPYWILGIIILLITLVPIKYFKKKYPIMLGKTSIKLKK